MIMRQISTKASNELIFDFVELGKFFCMNIETFIIM